MNSSNSFQTLSFLQILLLAYVKNNDLIVLNVISANMAYRKPNKVLAQPFLIGKGTQLFLFSLSSNLEIGIKIILLKAI